MSQQRGIGTNVNFKVFARIKPIEIQNKIIEINQDNTVIIKDNSSKYKDKTTFQFNGAYDITVNQQTVWANTCEPCILKAIEGHNSCILVNGQTNSGKTYTLYGEDERYYIKSTSIFNGVKKDRRGLIPRTIEYLFRKSQELEDIREFVISCSIAEIFLDQVRDLGKAVIYNQQDVEINQVNDMYFNENLTIYENTNGQIVVKDLYYYQINKVIYFIFLNQKHKNNIKNLQYFKNKIFTINIVQKDKENENIPFMSSLMQFVDLAGNQKIAKSITEGHKFQDAVLINQQLTSLGKCLQQIAKSNKSIPYRESKLTRIIQNCLGISSHVILIITLNPDEQFFEDSLSTLQFVEKIKIFQNKNQSGIIQNNFANCSNENQFEQEPTNNVNDQMLKGLRDQIQELMDKIEYIKREHSQKMSQIQNLLGLEVDLDKLLSRSSQKDLQQFKMQREAVIKIENFQKINQELENKIERLKKCIEENRDEEFKKQEKQSCQIIEYMELIRKIKDQQNMSKMKTIESIRKNIQEREKELELMNKKQQILNEEKQNMIKNLPDNIKKLNLPIKNYNIVKQQTLIQIESQSDAYFKKIQKQYEKIIEVTKQQQEYILKNQNLEMEQLQEQVKLYSQQKKQYLIQLKQEFINLYDIVQTQNRILSKIQVITLKQQNIQQNIDWIIQLFKLLDQRHLKSQQSKVKLKENLIFLNQNNLLIFQKILYSRFFKKNILNFFIIKKTQKEQLYKEKKIQKKKLKNSNLLIMKLILSLLLKKEMNINHYIIKKLKKVMLFQEIIPLKLMILLKGSFLQLHQINKLLINIITL
ncbi:kinesin motor domain protein [Ichthyophthirius multifiliis]|uniref:Kinesin motor domain protein n=1 Tax=Ichthyophthirius multifiliis TaxID=5932 RepID=G0R401_ICHMU|nr:kinesin motor domain protein [Ichthyophthirius multifiliis]EGR27798.1 kinesin motor domain protein [Ichthyophthirius multifiliis]|eukprot:XP_004027143.1 kinesin motor domain protein [Ichthyophthirius multifiliis]